MQFEQKTITILDNDRQPVEVQAWQGIGTGLAYHHPIYKDEPSGAEYILVHVSTGMCFTRCTLPTEPEAQAFLVAVAALDPDQWNIDLDGYRQRYYYTSRVMELQHNIEAAYNASLLPRDTLFLYAVGANGDPIVGDTYDTESENPDDAHNKKCAAEFFSYYRNAVRVVLTRMDYKTGKHTDLHTYERATMRNAETA